jgi:protein gp37
MNNMYLWIGETWNPLAGECPHKCAYCSTKSLYPIARKKYSGKLRLVEKEFKNLGKDKTYFVCAQNDLFAEEVSIDFIEDILQHCNEYPLNTYVFQTKNPERYEELRGFFPEKLILGTTIETNREDLISKHSHATSAVIRADAMLRFSGYHKTFITIEPIMDFDLDEFIALIRKANPSFVNIGADSKRHHLPEPSKEKVMALISELKKQGIEIRQKSNLERLLK